ncbi:MAG: response regulator [Bdellovibrionales bacterium]|nr:response regulator [Bdellovibrionales bacterium]
MRILVIDDEPLLRKALGRVGLMRGHTVFETSNGAEGRKIWQSERPELVFVDVLMPGISGPQLLKEMGTGHGAKVVLISAYSGDYNLEKAKFLGADMFVAKPFEDIFAIFSAAEALCR